VTVALVENPKCKWNEMQQKLYNKRTSVDNIMKQEKHGLVLGWGHFPEPDLKKNFSASFAERMLPGKLETQRYTLTAWYKKYNIVFLNQIKSDSESPPCYDW
jgi:hypothetical protein